MIGKKLKFAYSFCLFVAVLGCEHKDSASTSDLKNQVRVASTMAANLWCKNGGHSGDEKSVTLITYLGLGKISTYSIRKKNDPRQPWGFRYVAFKGSQDNVADYEYTVSPTMPPNTNIPGTVKYNLDIRPAVRKSWQETRLTGIFPNEILNSQPSSELVLRAHAYNRETTSVFHPCAAAGSTFVEFLSRDESIVNSHLLSTTAGRTLNARDNTNADRLLEIEWPVHEFTLSSEYLTSRRFCAVTPGYSYLKVDIYTLLPDGLLKVSTVNWSDNNKANVKTSTPGTDGTGGDMRARWEFKNDTLRLASRSAQPWDVIGSSNIWIARGYQDGSGRALIFARDKDRVTQVLQDCERFRNPATGGMTFGSFGLTGDKAKDGAESSTALDALYIDLNISWRN